MRGLRRLPVPFLLTLPVIFVLQGGCGSAGGMVRPSDPLAETSAGKTRTLDVSIRAEPPPDAIPLPHSVADEDRGRWLTLFTITLTPPLEAAPSEAAEPVPSLP